MNFTEINLRDKIRGKIIKRVYNAYQKMKQISAEAVEVNGSSQNFPDGFEIVKLIGLYECYSCTASSERKEEDIKLMDEIVDEWYQIIVETINENAIEAVLRCQIESS